MILLLQAIARLVTLLLLIALAVAGLALAIYSIPGGESGLPALAELIGLPVAWDAVGSFLDSLEAGDAAAVAVLGTLGAVLLGLLLLVGVLARRRERLVTLPPSGDEGDTSGGRLGARRRPIAQMAESLVGRPRDFQLRGLKVKPKRRGSGGSLRAKAELTGEGDGSAATQRIEQAVKPVAEPFALRSRVKAKQARGPA